MTTLTTATNPEMRHNNTIPAHNKLLTKPLSVSKEWFRRPVHQTSEPYTIIFTCFSANYVGEIRLGSIAGFVDGGNRKPIVGFRGQFPADRVRSATGLVNALRGVLTSVRDGQPVPNDVTGDRVPAVDLWCRPFQADRSTFHLHGQRATRLACYASGFPCRLQADRSSS